MFTKYFPVMICVTVKSQKLYYEDKLLFSQK